MSKSSGSGVDSKSGDDSKSGHNIPTSSNTANTTLAQMSITGPDAIIINGKLKELYTTIHEVQNDRNNSDHNLNNINKTHEKMTLDPSKSYMKTKLKSLYKTALVDCESEGDSLRKCLDIISEIRMTVKNRPRKNIFNKETSIRRGALMKMLLQYAQTLPLFVARTRDDKPPPLCGSVPAESSYIAKSGDMVAALVKNPDNSDESNWILAEVVHYNSSTSKYEIDDIDEDKIKHFLSKRRVVPLPVMRANPETDPDALFDKSDPVLALYPQTTCFYKGLIHKSPELPTDDYQILFEDPSYAEGYSPPLCVPQRYVIGAKELSSRKK